MRQICDNRGGVKESPNKGCITRSSRGSATAGSRPALTHCLRQVDIDSKLNTKFHLGWKLHCGALSGWIDWWTDWTGLDRRMVLRLEHGSVLKKSHLPMDVARCYKRDGLYGIGSGWREHLMVLTRKRGIELKENFNFWGKAKTVGHEDILFCQLIHENGHLWQGINRYSPESWCSSLETGNADLLRYAMEFAACKCEITCIQT